VSFESCNHEGVGNTPALIPFNPYGAIFSLGASNMKKINALFGVLALIVGLVLIAHGSSSAGVFNLPNLSLLEAREIYSVGLVQIMLGVGALVLAGISYRVYNQQY
jgi:hypothetical protein